MEIHHIFIFSNSNGSEAEELIKLGFSEGSSRVHPGQGTTNRKFYFENFFLEVLWVIDEGEIRSAQTASTKLWERSQYANNEYSPYGLCLVNSKDTNPLFKQSQIYQPSYLPEGLTIDIITNEANPQLPWTFRLPNMLVKNVPDEPMRHSNGIRKLTHATFEITGNIKGDDYLSHFQKESGISFKFGSIQKLTLEFDNGAQGKTKELAALGLKIQY